MPVDANRLGIAAAAIVFVLATAGCSSTATTDDIQAFNATAPIVVTPQSELPQAPEITGPYHVVPGDLLELQMPTVLQAVVPDAPSVFDIEPLRCRVSSEGTIDLPAVKTLTVSEKTLTEIEAMVVRAYYPKYVLEPPQVVAQVAEYRTIKVSIQGGVEKPGVYDLRSDEMSLTAAIMKAGGVSQAGAITIRVQPPKGREMLLAVKEQNIPEVNLKLQGGETLTIDRLSGEVFTVVGLVKNAGTFPYPANSQYNLVQALGFAGGLDDLAEPDYVRIVRKDKDGRAHSVKLKVSQGQLAKASDMPIRPGDIVYAEHTAASRTRLFFQTLLGRFGLHAGGSYAM